MPYCNAALVRDRTDSLAGLADDALAGGIAWGSQRIDGRLGGKYTVPFSPTVPDPIANLCADYAAYYTMRKLFMAGAEDQSVEGAKEILRLADLDMAQILKGEIYLGEASTSKPKSGIRSSRRGKSKPAMEKFDGVNRPNICEPPLAPARKFVGDTIDSLEGPYGFVP